MNNNPSNILKVVKLLWLSVFCLPVLVFAQVESPVSKYLFKEDAKGTKEAKSDKVKGLMRADKAAVPDIDFKAPEIEYLQEENSIKGSGGVLVSKEGIQIEAEQGLFNLDTKDAELEGNILFSEINGTLSASSAKINLDDETGEFDNASYYLEDGAYELAGRRILKLSERQFALEDTTFSTCHCEDETLPWCLKSSKINVTQESYAHAYHNWVKMWGMPIFYMPWFAFPVKQERSSGLLIPEYGYSGTDGFRLKLPIFIVLDDHTDITLTPFTETKTRYGSALDFRKAFSKYNNVESRFVYSDESARDGDLRGTVVNGLSDPEFDEDRFGGFYYHSWKASPQSGLKLSMIADVHYVSDDLFLREMEDEEIGKRNARYTTSSVVLRSALGDYGSLEVMSEYNQAMQSDDDLVFQRMPETNLNFGKSFRPFGFNPFGLKFVTRAKIKATDFMRKEGFDGWRTNLNPSVKIPFHFKNYLNNEIEVGMHQTYYNMDDVTNPSGGDDYEASADRTVAYANYKTSTALERVYDIDADSILKTLTSIGARNQARRLRRVKHVIEPTITFAYTPDTTQDHLPLYDSLDRMREKSLFTYGVKTSLWGRFDSIRGAGDKITELTPRIEDLPMLNTQRALSPFGELGNYGSLSGTVPKVEKDIRELANLSLIQSWDYKEDVEDNDPNRSPLSDLGFKAGIFPTRDFGFSFDSNFDTEDREFSSWSVGTHIKDDRDDILRARYNYIDGSVSQLEANLEVVLSERLKFGAYSRYDDEDHEFIENRLALRLLSGCNCWYLDLGYNTMINPDKEQVILTFSFKGLGDVAQSMRLGDTTN